MLIWTKVLSNKTEILSRLPCISIAAPLRFVLQIIQAAFSNGPAILNIGLYRTCKKRKKMFFIFQMQAAGCFKGDNNSIYSNLKICVSFGASIMERACCFPVALTRLLEGMTLQATCSFRLLVDGG